jgi:hypothetical protein
MAGLSTGTTATTAQANEVCVGCIGFDISDSFGSPTNSFTEITEASGAPDLVVLERIVSATGTYGTTVSFTGSLPLSYSLCGAIATFKEAGGGGAFDRKKSSTFLVFS